jgi:hypothetical protein
MQCGVESGDAFGANTTALSKSPPMFYFTPGRAHGRSNKNAKHWPTILVTVKLLSGLNTGLTN